MSRYSLHFPIRVPDDVLVELGEFTGKFWSDSLGQEPFVIEAIRNYIKPAPPAPQQPVEATEAGYQWKQVFLPEGTRLRASFGRQPYFATVVGAEIKYDGHAVSPSCFANLHGSGNRNAWKAVWLRLPGSNEWLLADVCRSARKAAIARLHGDGAQADSQRSRAPERLPQGLDQPPPAARQFVPRQTEIRSPSVSAAPKGNGAQPKSSSGRSARRRKRRAAKQSPGNP
ncbi:hypothetical protein [Duganella violaceipulchra]|uniref:DUF2924 domain-containing protein n=1 Tax=Duganella violaceipulchra TaxID=2849652 RepID=A0AA41HAS2_9BURK|nr:hypothetical protein [Duganella violaceicalia]MBV6323940.1 hypothetical protein [Duganella violaceicalia]MCP2011079.1 hypothetical protein [Duganella violaceicalia]